MRISIFGLGYVGCVSAASLAAEGHEVIGVDPNPTKRAMIEEGRSPVIEPGLEALMAEARACGMLSVTEDAGEAVLASELSFVCVGTPSRKNGSLDLGALEKVAGDIGQALRAKESHHVVAVRSTALPGTLEGVFAPRVERAAGKRAGEGFALAQNPEFLREGSALADYRRPPKTVIGTRHARAAEMLSALYEKIDAPLIVTAPAVAEMAKYADNAWHALKVAFANEIGTIAKAARIDGHEVMDIFCRDETLNISPAYLRPGFAFGGSCLPKDLRALTYDARGRDLELPVLEAVLTSNRRHLERGIEMILGAGRRRVAILGLSFKAGTDDLRESPMVEVTERLIGKGLEVRIYDRNVRLAALVGANKAYIEERIPHIAKLLVPRLEDALAHGETVVIGNRAAEFEGVRGALRSDQRLVDFVRIGGGREGPGDYDGIAW